VKLSNVTISLDAMGGDKAPLSVIKGACHQASINAANNIEVKFLFYGDEKQITPLITQYQDPKAKLNYQIIHCDKVISSDEKPSTALRQGKNSSMWLAIEAVANKQADAVVSSGNTGALMAISRIVLRSLNDIHRPAIAGLIPSLKGNVAMLDLGANAECSAENLFEFAIMGDAFAKVMLGLKNPRIGLLNIGSEEVKGNDVIRLASSLIKESAPSLNFIGYVEGNEIAEGTADVVVADGFSGNIALKTAEGTAKFCKDIMRTSFESSFLAKLGYLLARASIKKASSKLDARLYNGAMFLGLNGIVVKSHGSSEHIGFANAIAVATELAKNNINDKINQEMELFQQNNNTKNHDN
jgi:glycerol-3-phosphate acyltransferase PlsX